MEYYSAIKNNETMPVAATWMDLVILNEVRQRKKKTNTIWYHLHVEFKYDTNEQIYEIQSHRHSE